MYLSEATPGGRDFGAPFWNHENVIKRGEHGMPGVTPFWTRDFRGFRKRTNEDFPPCRCIYLKQHLEGATSARRFGITKMSSRDANTACQESHPFGLVILGDLRKEQTRISGPVDVFIRGDTWRARLRRAVLEVCLA